MRLCRVRREFGALLATMHFKGGLVGGEVATLDLLIEVGRFRLNRCDDLNTASARPRLLPSLFGGFPRPIRATCATCATSRSYFSCPRLPRLAALSLALRAVSPIRHRPLSFGSATCADAEGRHGSCTRPAPRAGGPRSTPEPCPAPRPSRPAGGCGRRERSPSPHRHACPALPPLAEQCASASA